MTGKSSGDGGGGGGGGDNVRVCVRCRPLNRTELESGDADIVVVDERLGSVEVRGGGGGGVGSSNDGSSGGGGGGGGGGGRWTFDHAYSTHSKCVILFDHVVVPIVDSVMSGYNGTVFAYGQTGSGKTHTMCGSGTGTGDSPSDDAGIMPSTFAYIFNSITAASESVGFMVSASYCEVYQEEIYDLLVPVVGKSARKKLDLREDPKKGTFVAGLSVVECRGLSDVSAVVSNGAASRRVGSTRMNAGSSRSHSIFTLRIEQSVAGRGDYTVAHLHLVDLAGSERQKKTGAEGDRFDEAKAINWSLTVLGNCISALIAAPTNNAQNFIPYRDSKLTRLLKDSLGGNTKTAMIAAIGPAQSNRDETVSTLKYADRAKQIKNKPKINTQTDQQNSKIKQYQDEIQKLKDALAQREGRAPTSLRSPDAGDDDFAVRLAREQRAAIERDHLAFVESNVEISTAKLNDQSKQLESERTAIERLQKAIDDRSRQLLIGGSVVEAAAAQKLRLDAVEKELAQRHAEQAKLRNELEEFDSATAALSAHYVSLQDELIAKSTALQRLYAKYTEKKAELSLIQSEFADERAALVETVSTSSRRLNAATALCDYLIPRRYLSLLKSRAVYDESIGEWRLPHSSVAGGVGGNGGDD